MKRLGFIFALIALFQLFFNCSTVKAGQNPPEISAKAAVVMEASTGRILYAKNEDLKLPMASTTKIMTAILAIEKGKLDDTVSVSHKAVYVEGSKIYLKPGEKIKLEDLIYGVMLESGNDAAIAVAEHIGGNLDNFVQMMNAKALSIGAYDTHFNNPHGLDSGIEDHFTTAKDLALITAYALKNPIFSKIVSTKTKTMSSSSDEKRYFSNHNKMLWIYPGADGVKTGYTRKAGRCLVTSATRDGMRLIVVTLNDPNDWRDTENLLNYGFENFKYRKVVSKGEVLKVVPVYNGRQQRISLFASSDVYLPVGENEFSTMEIKFMVPAYFYAPIYKGTKLGYAAIYVEKERIALVDLLASESINEDRSNFIDILRSII